MGKKFFQVSHEGSGKILIEAGGPDHQLKSDLGVVTKSAVRWCGESLSRLVIKVELADEVPSIFEPGNNTIAGFKLSAEQNFLHVKLDKGISPKKAVKALTHELIEADLIISRGDVTVQRDLATYLADENVVVELAEMLAPRFQQGNV